MRRGIGIAARAVSCGAVLAACGGVRAANVYVLSSGSATIDAAVVGALTFYGHTATLGVGYTTFDGTQSLSGFQTVYLQTNYNWALGDMPLAGQQAISDWVHGGGRLVTGEWTAWKAAAGNLAILGPLLPVTPATSYDSTLVVTLEQATANGALNAGVPASFATTLDNYAGTETLSHARAEATTYYTNPALPGVAALAGWGVGSGFVFSFNTTCGENEVREAAFGRLFANAMGAAAPAVCYANCDGSSAVPVLNIADFTCFLQKFAAADPYANCDASSQAPTLNIADFTCFLQKFAAGCP